RDLSVLRAVSEVPRHRFVPEAMLHRAYEDSALPIGMGQTISQPSIQAISIEKLALTGKEKVLEIGTGSGYQTALLAMCAGQVFTLVVKKDDGTLDRRAVVDAIFVPLLGKHGFHAE